MINKIKKIFLKLYNLTNPNFVSKINDKKGFIKLKNVKYVRRVDYNNNDLKTCFDDEEFCKLVTERYDKSSWVNIYINTNTIKSFQYSIVNKKYYRRDWGGYRMGFRELIIIQYKEYKEYYYFSIYENYEKKGMLKRKPFKLYNRQNPYKEKKAISLFLYTFKMENSGKKIWEKIKYEITRILKYELKNF